MHQLWQAVILKPLKLGECILHFWKPPIFINLVLAGQEHNYILNTQKAFLKIASFKTVYLVGVNSQMHTTVKTMKEDIEAPGKRCQLFSQSWKCSQTNFFFKIGTTFQVGALMK